MRFLTVFALIFALLVQVACSKHTLVPESQLKNIQATANQDGKTWLIKMRVLNSWRMSIALKENYELNTIKDGEDLVVTWSVNETRINQGTPFKLLLRSGSEEFPVELTIPNSVKSGYTLVLIAKILTGH